MRVGEPSPFESQYQVRSFPSCKVGEAVNPYGVERIILRLHRRPCHHLEKRAWVACFRVHLSQLPFFERYTTSGECRERVVP